MGIYEKIIKNNLIMFPYRKLKKIKRDFVIKGRVIGKYKFIDRKKDKKKVCFILAGYKEFLYDDVFTRFKRYIPKDFDICIVSSGLFSEKLSEIAEENNWSYLSVKKNKVTLAQNIAINIFDKAEYILKIDEDIFLMKNTITKMVETYNALNRESLYNVGFVAPLIPINGYAHVRVLEKLNLKSSFEKKFGKVQYNWSTDYKAVSNPEFAKYMWGEGNNILNNLDLIDSKLSKEKFSYSISPIRFSIGCIYFSRNLWNEIGRFKVEMGTNMGIDEIQLCDYIFSASKVIAVAENTIAGHFSYGPQTSEMRKYYEKNRDIFKIRNEY